MKFALSFTKKRTTVFGLSAVLLLTMTATAGHRSGNGAGNGGAAILIDGQFCLLDLAQSGACANPYTDPKASPSLALFDNIRAFYPEIEPEVTSLLGAKLVEFKAINAPLALILESRLARHKYFVVMANAELKNPYFEKSPIRYEEMELYRLALRLEPLIYLSPYVFPKLSPPQKAATLFHELLSAILEEDGDTVVTREFVSEIYKFGTPREILTLTLAKNAHTARWSKAQAALDEKETKLVEYANRFVIHSRNFGVEIGELERNARHLSYARTLKNPHQMSQARLKNEFQAECMRVAQMDEAEPTKGYLAAIHAHDLEVSEYRYEKESYTTLLPTAEALSFHAGADCAANLLKAFNRRMGRN